MFLFGPGGWFEPFFAERGIQIIFAVPSMTLVTIFICIPFVIRELSPCSRSWHRGGRGRTDAGRIVLQTFFRVTLPNIRWGLLYGIALTTARAMERSARSDREWRDPGQTETATLYIFRALEEGRTHPRTSWRHPGPVSVSCWRALR